MTTIVHATALILRTHGLLIRGPSASGKSLLARDLILLGQTRSIHAVLVGDDRVRLRSQNGRLICESHPAIPGFIEMRHRGIVRTRFRKSAIIRLVVDLVPPTELERMPEDEDRHTEILGVRLPRQPLAAGQRVALDIVLQALRDLEAGI